MAAWPRVVLCRVQSGKRLVTDFFSESWGWAWIVTGVASAKVFGGKVLAMIVAMSKGRYPSNINDYSQQVNSSRIHWMNVQLQLRHPNSRTIN